MTVRRGWKKGDWKVQDQESGFPEYGTNVGYDYYGVLKVKNQMDQAHPQDFIRAKEDPTPIYPENPLFRAYNLTESVVGFTVGVTNVPTVTDSPSLHIYRPGVDFAEIEYDLFVY